MICEFHRIEFLIILLFKYGTCFQFANLPVHKGLRVYKCLEPATISKKTLCNSLIEPTNMKSMEFAGNTSQLGLIFSDKVFSSGLELSSALNILKSDGLIKKWDSTLLEPKPTSKQDLYMITRTSFSTKDYLQDIINNARIKDNFDFANIAYAITFTCMTSIIIPQLEISDFYKNILGILSLSTPFMILLITILFPNFTIRGLTSTRTNQRNEAMMLRERIAYHEAGHFLAGYLCGIPILGYVLSSIRSSNTILEFPLSQSDIINSIKKNAGHMLVVAMSGVVAETLCFGDSKGGLEDFPVALEVLRQINIPENQRESYLRWAVLKALILLRIHRSTLDCVANAMTDGISVNECFARIESIVEPFEKS